MPAGSRVTVALRWHAALRQCSWTALKIFCKRGHCARRLPSPRPKINRWEQARRNKLRRLRGASEDQSEIEARVQQQGTAVRSFVPTAARRRGSLSADLELSITSALCCIFGLFIVFVVSRCLLLRKSFVTIFAFAKAAQQKCTEHSVIQSTVVTQIFHQVAGTELPWSACPRTRSLHLIDTHISACFQVHQHCSRGTRA